jgi:hypothetical protein
MAPRDHPFIRMQTQKILRFAPILAVALLLAGGLAHASDFPPLNKPAATEYRPGKLVWADLFTADPDGAAKFYCGLLGWEATTLDQRGKGYTIFWNDGKPVAGVAPRSVKAAAHPSRWIGYLAVSDIAAALDAATKRGVTVHAPARQFPNRGTQAIIGDRDGIPMGLIQSSSGDAPDGEPKPGEWNWFELYVRNPGDTATFYHDAIGFDVAPQTNSGRKSEFILSSAGQARGGVAPLPEGDDVKPSWLGVIRVADIDKTLAMVPGLGGEVLVAPRQAESGSRFAIILDPTGGTIGLVQYLDNANPANRK